MTLDTRVYILDEVDPASVFAHCQQLLAVHDEKRRSPAEQKSTNTQDKLWLDGKWIEGHPDAPWSLDNEPMQGLPAWLMTHYRPGAPYRTAEQSAAHDECDEYKEPGDPPCTLTEHDPACWMEISFDTAYGYKHNGMGCGDPHALLVAGVAGWCTERGLRWKWRNEFTSEVHDDLESLVGLLSGGSEAQAWFQTTVMPAIASGLLGGGR